MINLKAEAKSLSNNVRAMDKRISIAKNWNGDTYSLRDDSGAEIAMSQKLYDKCTNLIDGEYFEDDDFDGYNVKRKEMIRVLESLSPSRKDKIDGLLQNDKG